MATAAAFSFVFFASTSALAAELAPLDKVQSRTADALGLETGDFTVSDLEKDGVATRYRVTTNSGEQYSCYVTSTSGFVGFMSGGASVSDAVCNQKGKPVATRSEAHTSELQSLMRISYAVFCLKNKKNTQQLNT